jgi:enoyl-[acyl-carrier-protein] reductase (NADH)
MQYLEHDRHGHSGDAGVPAAILATDVAKGVTGSLAEVDTGYHVWGEGAPW